MIAKAYSQARRVALASDSHGALHDDVLRALADADLIVHAGDVGASAVLDALAALALTVAIMGNNDTREKWALSEHTRLAQLVDVAEFALSGGSLVAVHGHQWPKVATRHAKIRMRFPHARCVVYGHSHRLIVDRDADPWVVNPGACGRSRTYGGASWLGLTVGRKGWRITESRFD